MIPIVVETETAADKLTRWVWIKFRTKDLTLLDSPAEIEAFAKVMHKAIDEYITGATIGNHCDH